MNRRSTVNRGITGMPVTRTKFEFSCLVYMTFENHQYLEPRVMFCWTIYAKLGGKIQTSSYTSVDSTTVILWNEIEGCIGRACARVSITKTVRKLSAWHTFKLHTDWEATHIYDGNLSTNIKKRKSWVNYWILSACTQEKRKTLKAILLIFLLIRI